jgi:hypothetical protein
MDKLCIARNWGVSVFRLVTLEKQVIIKLIPEISGAKQTLAMGFEHSTIIAYCSYGPHIIGTDVSAKD